jgi:hypothetical protein
MLRAGVVATVISAFCLAALTTGVKRTGPQPAGSELAELWVNPGGAARNLFDGPGGPNAERPAKDARYQVLKRDTAGFSITYRVRDERGREWNVKIGPEAQTEVVTSRIVWALGYHQLPSYFVERWTAVTGTKDNLLGGARFRPHELRLKSRGVWSWQENPFVGTPPYQGLLVLMMILNSTDLKNDNNELYDVVGRPRDGAPRWYVVKDLGASLGETGRIDPRRGFIDGFEREPFIAIVDQGRVRFGFRGRHQELLERIGVDDVHWMCERLQKITDRQLREAFRAGNYSDELTTRYVARIRQKIDEGLKLR